MRHFYNYFKIHFLFLIWLANISNAFAQSRPAILWEKTYGAVNTERLFGAIATSDGGFLLAGTSNSPINMDKTSQGNGKVDAWIVKLNASGEKLWDKSVGGTEDDYIVDVKATPDGGFVFAGWSKSPISGNKNSVKMGLEDAWAFKLDALGNLLWDKTFNGGGPDILQSQTRFNSVAITNDGQLIFAASSSADTGNQKTEPSRGADDIWLVRTDTDGNIIWDKTYGSANVEDMPVVITAADGGFLVGCTSQGGIGGDRTEASRGVADYWMVKTDSQGNKQWDKRFGGTGFDAFSDLLQTPDGGYVLAGYSSSGVGGDRAALKKNNFDYWIVKIAADGSQQWDKAYGTYNNATSQLMKISAANGGFLLAGNLNSVGIGGDKNEKGWGGDDIWILKIDFNGNKIWDKTLGSYGTDYANAVVELENQEILVAGYSDSSGGDKAAYKSGIDYWAIKLIGNTLAIDQSSILTSYERGKAYAIAYQSNQIFDNNNEIKVYLSDADGNFVNEREIGWMYTTRSSGEINFHLPYQLPEGNHYKLRVKSSSPQETTVEMAIQISGTIKNVIPASCNPTLTDPNLSPNKGIMSVKLNTLSHYSAINNATSSNTYVNYANDVGTYLNYQKAYVLELIAFKLQKMTVFVDVNNNGIFDANELIYSSREALEPNEISIHYVYFSINQPGVVFDTPLRLRVIADQANGPTNSCVIKGGQIKDYYVVIKPPLHPSPEGILFVDKSKIEAGMSGDNWATAINDLNLAINHAQADNQVRQIWVAKGTYVPSLSGDRYSFFTLPSGVKLIGGFAGTESSPTERNLAANITTLSGDLNQNDQEGYFRYDDNSYHILQLKDVNAQTLVDGFTFVSGCSNGTAFSGLIDNKKGPAIYNYNSLAEIQNCIFTKNYAEYDGAGVFNTANSHVKITNSLFYKNWANYGGAILNTANSSSDVLHCTFANNLVAGVGNGAAIYNQNSPAGFLRNSIVWNNTPNGQIINENSTNFVVRDNIISGGYDSQDEINHIYNLNPVFISETTGDYRIANGSPAQGKGELSIVPASLKIDLIGNQRVLGQKPDLGAYEFEGVKPIYQSYPLVRKTYGEQDFQLVNPVSSSSGSFTFKIINDQEVVGLNGNTVSIKKPGFAFVMAVQAATEVFKADSMVFRVDVDKRVPQITGYAHLQKTYGDSDFQINTPTSSSSGTFTYSSSNSNIASISGSNVTIHAAGTITITATQAETDYDKGASVSFTLTVGKAQANLVLKVDGTAYTASDVVSAKYGDTRLFTLETNSDIDFQNIQFDLLDDYLDPYIDFTNIPFIKAIKVGNTELEVRIPETDNYFGVSQRLALQISKATSTINFVTVPALKVGDADYTLQATSSAGLPVTFNSSNPNIASVYQDLNGQWKLKVMTMGSVTITANQDANLNYEAAVSTQQIQITEDPLPVNLISFNAKATANGALLEWKTATERNNTAYHIYRATNGVSFVKIAEVKGNGNSDKVNVYQYIDSKPMIGVNYYQLYQIDDNGDQHDLGIRDLNFSVDGTKIITYPNPTYDAVTVSFPLNSYEHLEVIDMNGKRLQKLQIKPSETSIKLNLSDYPTGMYFIRLIGNAMVNTQKIIKK